MFWICNDYGCIRDSKYTILYFPIFPVLIGLILLFCNFHITINYNNKTYKKSFYMLSYRLFDLETKSYVKNRVHITIEYDNYDQPMYGLGISTDEGIKKVMRFNSEVTVNNFYKFIKKRVSNFEIKFFGKD